MSAMQEIEWEACLLEPLPDPALERRWREATGRPSGVVRYFVGSERGSEVLLSLSTHLAAQVHIPSELADVVGLVVSQDNSCRYCFGATRTLLRVLGLRDERIRELELDLHTAEFDEKERAALDFARKLSRSNPLTTKADLRRLLELGFEEMEVRELASVIAMHLFFNRVSTFVALPPKTLEELPDRRFFSLIRPLIGLRLRGTRRRVAPTSLEPGQAEGPFSTIVEALDGLPIAGELRRLIDAAFDPMSLQPRTVGLIFAVIARALGCRYSEEEAVAWIEARGMGRDEIEEALTHLSSAKLDDLERVLLPFARDTVWYQPASIQRRGREALQDLSREQFLEFVAVASLANSVCRLAVLTGDCE